MSDESECHGAPMACYRLLPRIHDSGYTEVPSARALLALRRSSGAADRRGARGDRSGSARSAVWRAAAAVFDHAGLSTLDLPDFDRALELARASAEFRETGSGAARRYRARFWSSDAARLRDLFQIVGASDATEVLIDDRPVPYARELWLPLVWFLLPR